MPEEAILPGMLPVLYLIAVARKSTVFFCFGEFQRKNSKSAQVQEKDREELRRCAKLILASHQTRELWQMLQPHMQPHNQ